MKRNKQQVLMKKRSVKKSKMKNPGQRSKYAKKRTHLFFNDLWGFEVPEPKPWK